MNMHRYMESCGTTIEIAVVGLPDEVVMRYVAPVASGWVKEHYSLAALIEQEWEIVEGGE